MNRVVFGRIKHSVGKSVGRVKAKISESGWCVQAALIHDLDNVADSTLVEFWCWVASK